MTDRCLPAFLAIPGLVAAPPAADRVQDLLGIPYVADGVMDAAGRWTTFARPGQFRNSPGLNCSGFTYVLARRLLGSPLTPAQAGTDRLGDSGAEAPAGPDWDFGLDLILNLSEHLPRRVLTPDGTARPAGDGRHSRGFDLDAPGIWEALLPRLRRDRVYLVSLSRGTSRIQHYHSAVILADPKGIWFHHTLPGGVSHRINLQDPVARAGLLARFGHGKKILLLEVDPPIPVR